MPDMVPYPMSAAEKLATIGDTYVRCMSDRTQAFRMAGKGRKWRRAYLNLKHSHGYKNEPTANMRTRLHHVHS